MQTPVSQAHPAFQWLFNFVSNYYWGNKSNKSCVLPAIAWPCSNWNCLQKTMSCFSATKCTWKAPKNPHRHTYYLGGKKVCLFLCPNSLGATYFAFQMLPDSSWQFNWENLWEQFSKQFIYRWKQMHSFILIQYRKKKLHKILRLHNQSLSSQLVRLKHLSCIPKFSLLHSDAHHLCLSSPDLPSDHCQCPPW